MLGTALCLGMGEARTEVQPGLEPLKLHLPAPGFRGTPRELPKGEHIESWRGKPRPPFLAPVGAGNLALRKKVTASTPSTIGGRLEQITDGDKEALDDSVVELRKGVQWVQIDLEASYPLYAILLWHDHRELLLFRCVVVQIADDADFTRNVRTLFNNDYENEAGLGCGQEKQYFETFEGKMIDAHGAKARYVRCYSRGSTDSALNCYTEIEVYGLKEPAPEAPPQPLPVKLPMPGFR